MNPGNLELVININTTRFWARLFITTASITDLTRYLNDWFGVEGAVAIGFGNTGTPQNLTAKSLFVGGGPHVAVYNKSRFEPWAHALVGLQHFRFTQATGLLGSNSTFGFMGGAEWTIS